jgi:hypothetical protein
LTTLADLLENNFGVYFSVATGGMLMKREKKTVMLKIEFLLEEFGYDSQRTPHSTNACDSCCASASGVPPNLEDELQKHNKHLSN